MNNHAFLKSRKCLLLIPIKAEGKSDDEMRWTDDNNENKHKGTGVERTRRGKELAALPYSAIALDGNAGIKYETQFHLCEYDIDNRLPGKTNIQITSCFIC